MTIAGYVPEERRHAWPCWSRSGAALDEIEDLAPKLILYGINMRYDGLRDFDAIRQVGVMLLFIVVNEKAVTVKSL